MIISLFLFAFLDFRTTHVRNFHSDYSHLRSRFYGPPDFEHNSITFPPTRYQSITLFFSPEYIFKYLQEPPQIVFCNLLPVTKNCFIPDMEKIPK